MRSPSLGVFFLLFAFDSTLGNSCGGLLEGERGHFVLPDVSNRDPAGTSDSPCLWIIQLHYKSNIKFTLDDLRADSHLNVYPEDQLTMFCNLNGYTKLNSTHIGSSFEFPGKTLIVILPNASTYVALSWEFAGEENSSMKMKNSDYVNSPNGILVWQQLETVERVTWAINTNENFHMKWDVDVGTPCGQTDSCACLYFAVLHLTSKGVLSEAVRACGQSTVGKIQGLNGRAVVLIKVNTKVKANKITVSWESDDVAVTEPPVTGTPVPTATKLFAATTLGLLVVDLQTAEATSITSEYTITVAVNHNLQKIYWSEVPENSRILRSNVDGSSVEIIIPPTGDTIHMLAIDEPSGNVIYALIRSQEITVCNSFGVNCAAVISSSSLVNQPIGIALDSEKGVMYWSSVPNSLFRANLDGSNATVISTEFRNLYGLALDQSSNNVLYWADGGENAIGTIDITNGNKRTFVGLEGDSRPFGIQVDADKIYFSNFNSGNIQSVDRNSGEELTTIFKTSVGVRHLALFKGHAKNS